MSSIMYISNLFIYEFEFVSRKLWNINFQLISTAR